MKKNIFSISLFCNIIFLGLLLSSYKFESAHAEPPTIYIVEYSKGSSWDTKKEFNDQKYSKHHSDYLQSLRKQGVIQFGARYADKGIAFIAAMGMENAKHIVNSDSAVINKLFAISIHELNVFYEYNSEKTSSLKENVIPERRPFATANQTR